MDAALVLDFRSSASPGAVVTDPRGMQCGGAGGALPCSLAAMGQMAHGRPVLFAAHGFNVRRNDALALMPRLAAALAGEALFVGISWPGDWWIKAVNYPGEAFDARDCGARLAAAIDTHFADAASVSFLSHSLGARLVLEAAARTRARIGHVMLMAAAVDDDCLSTSYASVMRKAEGVHVLSSRRDRVLRFAYPVGDFVSDLLGDGDSPFRAALGYRGPRHTPAALHHTAIPASPRDGAASGFDHNDYLPEAPRSAAAMRWAGAAMQGRTRWT